jgi:hypothetical protein
MSARSSSRVYNTAALERWFANVGLDWEQSFSRETLLRGREIYRKGQISGIELANEEAIVHCQFARKDTCYAVIEWTATGPKVRSSVDDGALGEAVGVGGLYEVEELIADEIDPLPYEPNPEAEESLEEPEPRAEQEATPARLLTPKLEGLSSGLRLTAYWTNLDLSQESAFRSDEAPIHPAERELLVRLTGRAGEAGFKFRRDSNDFILYDGERIAPFFSHALKRWDLAFDTIDLDLEAQRMAEGVREVKVIGRVESSGQGQMRVDWRLKLGRQWLDPEDAERLVKAGRGTHVVRGLRASQLLARSNRQHLRSGTWRLQPIQKRRRLGHAIWYSHYSASGVLNWTWRKRFLPGGGNYSRRNRAM